MSKYHFQLYGEIFTQNIEFRNDKTVLVETITQRNIKVREDKLNIACRYKLKNLDHFDLN